MYHPINRNQRQMQHAIDMDASDRIEWPFLQYPQSNRWLCTICIPQPNAGILEKHGLNKTQHSNHMPQDYLYQN